ncbi:uncharacterized protein LY89DRAFT_88485 [Mollisia scopiformis]|uniref:Uncharacterized protein n=1 Tax=Mollisia scopiformis TaxID=149040 RepID=A0A194X940_MOLSC|nr:uncharacterized protein LY89DRAFT_88485 [Mollisia scopiformis]KUJ16629.1 hypothetical protein LY89DRAFT_88485 [Mollisia scopiformis]
MGSEGAANSDDKDQQIVAARKSQGHRAGAYVNPREPQSPHQPQMSPPVFSPVASTAQSTDVGALLIEQRCQSTGPQDQPTRSLSSLIARQQELFRKEDEKKQRMMQSHARPQQQGKAGANKSIAPKPSTQSSVLGLRSTPTYKQSSSSLSGIQQPPMSPPPLPMQASSSKDVQSSMPRESGSPASQQHSSSGSSQTTPRIDWISRWQPDEIIREDVGTNTSPVLTNEFDGIICAIILVRVEQIDCNTVISAEQYLLLSLDIVCSFMRELLTMLFSSSVPVKIRKWVFCSLPLSMNQRLQCIRVRRHTKQDCNSC